MRVEDRVKEVIEKVYISEDGREFSSENKCKKHESFLRGKLLAKHKYILGESRYYFKADTADHFEDALTFIENHFCSDFLSRNCFIDFKNQWVFTDYDDQGEFYRLITSHELFSRCALEISRLDLDKNFLENLHNEVSDD